MLSGSVFLNISGIFMEGLIFIVNIMRFLTPLFLKSNTLGWPKIHFDFHTILWKMQMNCLANKIYTMDLEIWKSLHAVVIYWGEYQLFFCQLPKLYHLETQVQSLGPEDPLEKEMATQSSILAWKIPWAEEPGGLESMGSQRVGHDCTTKPHTRVLRNSLLFAALA